MGEAKLHMHPAQKRIFVKVHKCSDCGGEMEEYYTYPVGIPKARWKYFRCLDCGTEIRDV